MALPWTDIGGEIDLDALHQALQQALPDDQRIDALRLLKVRRSASRRRDPHPVRLWLEAQWHDRRQARHGVQRLYGKAYRDGASAFAWPAARQAALAAPAFGAAVCHVDTLDLLLWAWPNDPALGQLPLLLQPDTALRHLPAAPGERALAHALLRYEPEQRATLRWALAGPGGARRDIYGKTFADARQAQCLHRRFEELHRLSRQHPDAPCVAEPLGVDEATRTLWQACASGLPLRQLVDGPRADALLAAVGRALARLHALPLHTDTGTALGDGSERGVEHWRTEIARRQRKIARGVPALAARSEALLRRLDDAAAALPRPTPTLIHGDFHHDQVWIDGGRPVFFDFDEFCAGHPMEDLASFGIKLQPALPAVPAEPLVRAFERAYRESAPARWCAPTLAWHRAVQALLQAARAFVFQVPGWPCELQARLTRAEALALEVSR